MIWICLQSTPFHRLVHHDFHPIVRHTQMGILVCTSKIGRYDGLVSSTRNQQWLAIKWVISVISKYGRLFFGCLPRDSDSTHRHIKLRCTSPASPDRPSYTWKTHPTTCCWSKTPHVHLKSILSNTHLIFTQYCYTQFLFLNRKIRCEYHLFHGRHPHRWQ